MNCHICNYYTPETGCDHYQPENMELKNTGLELLQAVKAANKTKPSMAYIIGMLNPHSSFSIYYDTFTKPEVFEAFQEAIEDNLTKTAKALRNSSSCGTIAQKYLSLQNL